MRCVVCGLVLLCTAGLAPAQQRSVVPAHYAEKPFTRWWWFASVIDTADVAAQLDWLARSGFGGVEIAWVYPLRGDSAAARDPWLSPAWADAVTFAKRAADARGLQCDFTFGTLWPFGDSQVPPEDGALFHGDSSTRATMRLTWEHPARGRVLNHLDRHALARYAARVGGALAPALEGPPSALFCDSWEVETRKLWHPLLPAAFRTVYRYELEPYMDSLLAPRNAGVFYDYMALLSDVVTHDFYGGFTGEAHARGAFSRAQCGGAPADLLDAFAAVDVPESEAVLFDAPFARIAASAAALHGKSVVTAESFTCAYGWKGWPGPSPHQGEEKLGDLKLIADALFANGVNGIVWHGTPYNPPGRNEMFYASVHVSPLARFAPALPAFNAYLAAVSTAMRRGRTHTDAAVYLPTEDAWMQGALPDSLQLPWAWGAYEMRYARPPAEVQGRQPLWINPRALAEARVEKGNIVHGNAVFRFVYVDVAYMAPAGLRALNALAARGARIVLRRDPRCPGRDADTSYARLLRLLKSRRGVVRDIAQLRLPPPLLAGTDLPEYWARTSPEGTTIFFANPASRRATYPLPHGIGDSLPAAERSVRVHAGGRRQDLTLRFEGNQSLLLEIGRDGKARFIDINYPPEAR